MKKVKLVAMFLAMVLVLGSLVGCAQKQVDKQDDAQETVSITIMHYMGEQSKRETLNAIVEAFEKAIPALRSNLNRSIPVKYIKPIRPVLTPAMLLMCCLEVPAK